jgi:hypothetical protein
VSTFFELHSGYYLRELNVLCNRKGTFAPPCVEDIQGLWERPHVLGITREVEEGRINRDLAQLRSHRCWSGFIHASSCGKKRVIDEPAEQLRATFGGGWGEKGASQGERCSAPTSPTQSGELVSQGLSCVRDRCNWLSLSRPCAKTLAIPPLDGAALLSLAFLSQ